MKTVAALLCLVAATQAVSFFDLIKEEWTAFKLEHVKSYTSEVEDKFRMKIFAGNKYKIAKHNQRYQKGLVSYRLKPNKYADMLHHEFVHTMNGFNRTANCIETRRRSRVQTRKFLARLHILCPPTPTQEIIEMRPPPSQPIIIAKRRDRGW